MDDLRSAFQVDRVDPSELEQLLQSHFGASQAVTNTEIHYGRHQQPASLIVRYSKKSGRITRIENGANLAADDVAQIAEKVQSQLLNATEVRIGQTVLFSNLPLKGWFRYGDVFQLVPVPPEAPRPILGLSGHPLLMQFRYTGSTEMMINMARQTRVSRELELLCTALSVNIEGGIGITQRYHWSVVLGSDPSNPRSEYCLEHYMWPEASAMASGYSSVAGLEPVPLVPHEEYYSALGISVGQPMCLPNTFTDLLADYFRLNPDERDQYMRGSHWYQFARHAAGHSYSAGFNALVSAVEALMGPEPKSQNKCPTCSRPAGGGSKKRFLDFLNAYAPGPAITDQDRQRFYDLRSALAHGGRLLHSDRFSWGGMTPGYLMDWDAQRAMWYLVRIILVNWLAARAHPG